jgi:hypothetical protein
VDPRHSDSCPHARARPWVRQRRLDGWRRAGGSTAEPRHRNGLGRGRPWRAQRGAWERGGKRRASPHNDEHLWDHGRRHMELQRSTRHELRTGRRGSTTTPLHWAASRAAHEGCCGQAWALRPRRAGRVWPPRSGLLAALGRAWVHRRAAASRARVEQGRLGGGLMGFSLWGQLSGVGGVG